MTAAAIRRLSLANFRSYHAAQLEFGRAGPVVLTGANGAGKTNLIEAISLLAPGRGLRRATMEELAFSEGDGGWAVNAEAEGMLGLATLGTGIDPPAGEDSSPARKCRIDRESVTSATAFADHLRVVWLTPAMDPLFNGPASERRRFLDRLVLAVDAQHSGRVAALERSLRSRNRLLEDARSDPHWLDAVEHETAEVAVAVAAARAETVARLSAALAQARDDGFPRAHIALEGWMEQLLPAHSATEIEDRYRALLKDNRARDAAAGRTLDGPHLSDLAVSDAGKNIPAADASFDFAYTINVLHHLNSVEEQRRAFMELFRVLKPGGLLFVHEINTRNILFRFYMGYVFPSLNCIDEGVERWLLAHKLSTYTDAPVVDVRYFTFLPDFVPSAIVRLLAPVERLLERSAARVYSAHYMAVWRKP